MANRTRTKRNEICLNDREQYILDEKFRLSGMKSKSAFLRKLILYGYVLQFPPGVQHRAWADQFQPEPDCKKD